MGNVSRELLKTFIYCYFGKLSASGLLVWTRWTLTYRRLGILTVGTSHLLNQWMMI